MSKNYEIINEDISVGSVTELPRKIKVSPDKFNAFKGQFESFFKRSSEEVVIPVEEEVVSPVVSVVEPEKVDESSYVEEPIYSAEEPVTAPVVESVFKQPIEEPVVKEEPKLYGGVTYSTPEVKPISNPINIDNMIQKIKNESARSDSDTYYGKVLINGISRIDSVVLEKESLKNKYNELAEEIKSLQSEIAVAQNTDQGIGVLLKAYKNIDIAKEDLDRENKLQQTSNIDLGEIESALATTKKSAKELEEMKEKSNSEINLKNNSIISKKKEQKDLESSIGDKDKEIFEICRTIDLEKQKASEYMKRSSEYEAMRQKHDREEEKLESSMNELLSSMSLVKEEPKKPIGVVNALDESKKDIKNPFDKVREMELEVDEIGKVHTSSR